MGKSPRRRAESGLKKGPWTPEEDQKLVGYIHKHGYGSWRTLAKLAGLNRCGKSCRLGWTNYLRPDIKRGNFSEQEEQLIINLHSILGNKWSKIAAQLPGRTDIEIKNHWNTLIRKKLLLWGIDPITHNPTPNIPNLLTNLSRLTSASNLIIHPWDSVQLAKIQHFQGMIQVMNTSPLPNIAQSNLLGPSNVTQFDAQMEFPNNFDLNPQLAINDLAAIDDSMALIGSGSLQPEVPNFIINYNSQPKNCGYHNQEESANPALVSPSTESSFVNQIESKINASSNTPHSSIYEAWEKFLNDDDVGPWREILQ